MIEKIKAIYPKLTDMDFSIGFGSIRIQDDSDGKGPYIAAWNHPTLKKPTKKQLDGVTE